MIRSVKTFWLLIVEKIESFAIGYSVVSSNFLLYDESSLFGAFCCIWYPYNLLCFFLSFASGYRISFVLGFKLLLFHVSICFHWEFCFFFPRCCAVLFELGIYWGAGVSFLMFCEVVS